MPLKEGGRGLRRQGGTRTSLEPLPNPETTLPFMRRGNGASGPGSGPIIVGRGLSGRIFKNMKSLLVIELRERNNYVEACC
jgi:hypothetical protein